ncbi:MAG: phospholipid-binding protein MlaC [Parahaliea sp.]
MKRFERKLAYWMAILGLLFSAVALAQGGETAHQVVSAATEKVMKVVAGAREAGGDPSAAYFDGIDSILAPVVDFRGFARSVMGPYATSDRYRSLDEAGRKQLTAQLDRFSEKIREVMINTYGKGLLACGGSRIEVTLPSPSDASESRATVQQRIYKENAAPYVVLYQMGSDRDGQWKLRNMIIEGVNLGEIYRGQFQSAARRYHGDLDQVIDSWSVVNIKD